MTEKPRLCNSQSGSVQWKANDCQDQRAITERVDIVLLEKG